VRFPKAVQIDWAAQQAAANQLQAETVRVDAEARAAAARVLEDHDPLVQAARHLERLEGRIERLERQVAALTKETA
jgi:polyhydroxyalkanoate synthesis regulator phasin